MVTTDDRHVPAQAGALRESGDSLRLAIDATADPEALKAIAKQLLQAWHTQKAATNWVIGQQLGIASQGSPPSL